MAAQQAKGWENDLILITHGDCVEDAEYVAERVRAKMGVDNILINQYRNCDRKPYRTGSCGCILYG